MTQEHAAIVMYGTPWCGDCRRAKRFFERHSVGYLYIDIETQPESADLVERLNGGYRSVPTIVFTDGSVLVEPSDKALAAKLGLA